MTIPLDRRTFVKTTSAAALGLSALGAGRVMGANDRIRLGVIGTGNRGCQVMEFFLKHPGVEIPALCDVSRSAAEAANARLLGGKADLHSDFRKITDRKDIDAVLIATPDHWHATDDHRLPRQGRLLRKTPVETIHGRQISGPRSKGCRADGPISYRGIPMPSGQIHRLGKLGKITVTRAFDTTNMYPKGIGKALERSAQGPRLGDVARPAPSCPYQRRSPRSSFAGGTSTPRGSPTTACIFWTSCDGSSATNRGLCESRRWEGVLPLTTTAPLPTRWKGCFNSPRAR